LAIAVSILCGLVVHPRVYLLAGGLTLAVAVGVGWPWVTMRAVRGRIGFQADRAVEGESVLVSAAFSNHLPWAARGVAIRKFDDESPDLALDRLPALSTIHFVWQMTPMVRGEFPRERVAAASAFPFGLRDARRAVESERRLLVWPRTYPVGPPPVRGTEEDQEGRAHRNVAGSGGDVTGVRPYRPGDPVRRIHWRQTAKHDRLVVCERQALTRDEILLVLDTRLDVHTPGRNGSAEWSIRIAASFARGWLEAGARVGLAWSGGAVPVASGAAQIPRVMDALARIEFRSAGSFEEIVGSSIVRRARGVVVAITSRLGAARLTAGACSNVRLVTLDSGGFSSAPDRSSPADSWLDVPSPTEIPVLLKSGWKEARHGG
jgi:uncharacterized protein (DUF58 family)